MIFSVIISEDAEADIIRIADYISNELYSLQAAYDLMYEVRKQILALSHMPKRFALVDDERLASKGVRLIPVKNFLIFYVVDEEAKTVNIVGVMYGKRDWMNLL